MCAKLARPFDGPANKEMQAASAWALLGVGTKRYDRVAPYLMQRPIGVDAVVEVNANHTIAEDEADPIEPVAIDVIATLRSGKPCARLCG
jgi:hypothetical protein